MQYLVFYTQDTSLKVRLRMSGDDFTQAVVWKEKISFLITPVPHFTMLWTSFLPDLPSEEAEALLDLVSARYPVSPDFQKLKNLSPALSFTYPIDEWIFFAGSFNPWHQGHQACLSLLPPEKVCFILPDQNPEKELPQRNRVFTILEISSKGKLKPLQHLVPTFLLDGKKNPTIEWVDKLKEEFPNQKISLLMGYDSFEGLERWIRGQDLLSKIANIYVASRMESDEKREHYLKSLELKYPTLKINYLGRHSFEKISSTEIRRR